jgi:hypothetical protein
LSNQIKMDIKLRKKHVINNLANIQPYYPETLDKSVGLQQSAIGNLLVDVTLKKANLIFCSLKRRT